MRDYFQSPVNKSWVNFKGHPKGDAMDLGWRKGHGVNQDVFMMADGEVIWTGHLADGGNSIVTKHDYNSKFDAWVGLMHFIRPTNRKVGEYLKRGTKVGNMGKSGVSQGEHVHVRISLVPKGAPFKWPTFDKYRVNPFNYVFEFKHQDVLDMKKKPATPFKSGYSEVVEDGEITVTVKEGLRVRQAPSLQANQTGLLKKGTKKVYTHYVDNDGIRWVKLEEGGYAARRTLDNKEIYADARFINTPKPRPTMVGKLVTLSGNTRLYVAKTGGSTYPAPSTHKSTNLRTRHVKVLEESDTRVKVLIPGFDPEIIWILKSELR